jgi:dTMP kinase
VSSATESRPGLLITLEGGEGAGKSSQAAQLGARLREIQRRVIITREPGGTDLGEGIRALTREPAGPLAELFLFEAARAQLVSEVLRPALAAGNIVVLDRYTDSTLAYQGYGREIPLDQIRALNKVATGGLMPDLTLLLDIDVERGLARKLGEIGQDSIGHEHRAFHERVRDGYRALAAAEPQRWTVMDASRPAAEIADAIWDRVRRLLGARGEPVEP